MNQKEFGKLGRVGLQTQSRYETAETQPSAEYLAGLAANRVDVFYILTGERSDSAPLPRGATELLDDYFALPPDRQDLARALLKTMRDQATQPGPEPTIHEPALAYHGEGRG